MTGTIGNFQGPLQLCILLFLFGHDICNISLHHHNDALIIFQKESKNTLSTYTKFLILCVIHKIPTESVLDPGMYYFPRHLRIDDFSFLRNDQIDQLFLQFLHLFLTLKRSIYLITFIPSKDLTVIRCRIPICDEVDHRINYLPTNKFFYDITIYILQRYKAIYIFPLACRHI